MAGIHAAFGFVGRARGGEVGVVEPTVLTDNEGPDGAWRTLTTRRSNDGFEIPSAAYIGEDADVGEDDNAEDGEPAEDVDAERDGGGRR